MQRTRQGSTGSYAYLQATLVARVLAALGVALVLCLLPLRPAWADEADELFDAYVQQRIDESLGNSDNLGLQPQSSAVDNLGDTEKKVYNLLVGPVAQIAAGEQESTVIEVPIEDFLGDISWTAQDMGLEDLIVEGTDGQATINPQATSWADNELNGLLDFDLRRCITALMSDHPYEMYWYDKVVKTETVQTLFDNNLSYTAREIDGEMRMWPEGNLYFRLPVVEAYCKDGDRYAMNTERPARVKNALDRAAAIVFDNAGKDTTARLDAYREQICELTSYNHEAMADKTTPYGDPWQLIYVFDGDPETNVVCEGYSKAFKYLCDLSDFQDVECLIGGGWSMGSDDNKLEAHMWNVVRMPDGLNYLADLTNCDEGTVGAPDLLFLAPCKNIHIDSDSDVWYDYPLEEQQLTMSYCYDNDSSSAYPIDELKLCDMVDITGEATVTVEEGRYVYNGKAFEPKVTVTMGDAVLAEGTHYTVAYENNVYPGEATVTVTGTGVFTGTATGSFRIAKAPVNIVMTKTVYVGATINAEVAVFGSEGYDRELEFISTAPAVASVTAAGKITGRKVGTARVCVTAPESDYYAATTATIVVKVVKRANPLIVKPLTRSARLTQVRTRRVVVARPLAVSKAQGKLTYKKVGGSAALTVNATTGSVIVRKGTRKGSYAIRIRVNAAGNATYNSGYKIVTTRVVVR